MPKFDRDRIQQDVLKILTELREDWEYHGDISAATGIFRDLEFESIDAVALGSAIEDHYDRSLPFAEYLMKATERKVPDITVGELVEFLHEHLNKPAEGRS